ncbi:MAG: hypothetical protein WAU23_11770 [Ferruginibacter sp.]
MAQSQKKIDTTNSYKPEIFTSGFIDIMNDGQVNASARFIRLFIGEPEKFAIPISFFGGVSNNNFQSRSNTTGQQNNNDHLVNQYINPLSGLINISIDGVAYFKPSERATKTGFIYQIGERILTGYRSGPATDPKTGSPTHFLNSFATLGTYFQTGAWERNNALNTGIFWIACRYIGCYTNPGQIRDFLPDINTNGLYHGYSIGFGVEINNLVNLKALYYRYVKQPEIDYTLPIYQFSFNYSLKK